MILLPLSELALSAFAKYIQKITRKFLYTKGELLSGSHSQKLKQFCDRVEEIINVTVPVTLANKTSELLQQHILSTYKWRTKWLVVAQQILPAVLHKRTTEFVYVSNSNDTIPVQFSRAYLIKALEKIVSLKSLTTRIYIDTDVIHSLLKHKDLQKLTFADTNSSKQHELRSFDNAINDRIIPFIFKFNNLTHLDLINTDISYKGISQIMEEFSKKPTGKSMKVIKMNISPSHIILIPKAFPNLNSLEIFLSEAACILPLKELSKLVSLSVGICNNQMTHHDFTTVLGKLLQEVGHRLLKLHIKSMNDIDLKLISEKCPCLQNLGLHRYRLIRKHNDNNVQRKRILFPSLKHFELTNS